MKQRSSVRNYGWQRAGTALAAAARAVAAPEVANQERAILFRAILKIIFLEERGATHLAPLAGRAQAAFRRPLL
jgi:hypothetical protein